MNIVFDIGGTKMRVASAVGEVLGDFRKTTTPQNPNEAIAQFTALAKEVADGGAIKRAAGSIRGIIFDGAFWKDAMLPQWEGMRIQEELQLALGAPVLIKNDCAVIGLGENHAGAGMGSKIMAYVTVSTGVNGARIVGGAIDQYHYGFEIGRQFIGDYMLEDLISGTAVRKKFGIEPKDLDSLEERNKLADILALGLYNTVMHWSPDTIVIGGSMIIGTNPIPLPRVEASLGGLLTMFPKPPIIKMASLGDTGGLVGGAILASNVG